MIAWCSAAPSPSGSSPSAIIAARSSPATSASVWQYGYGPYDESEKRVARFTPLPYFTGQAWQGGANVPDPQLSYLMLTADGGHPGMNARFAAIRRWVAPMDCVVSIQGVLRHEGKQGDGVQGRIVSSRAGALGKWVAFGGKAETNVAQADVKKGDTLDFVVDCRSEHSFDSFTWAPTIRALTPGSGTIPASQGELQVWKASADFGGHGVLTAWEKYAQALLMTNEFCFVD